MPWIKWSGLFGARHFAYAGQRSDRGEKFGIYLTRYTDLSHKTQARAIVENLGRHDAFSYYALDALLKSEGGSYAFYELGSTLEGRAHDIYDHMAKELLEKGKNEIRKSTTVKTRGKGKYLWATDGEKEVPIHGELRGKDGEMRDVFLYRENNGQIAGMLEAPFIQVGEVAKLKVVAKSKIGYFVGINAPKDILLPSPKPQSASPKEKNTSSPCTWTSPSAWPCPWKLKTH